MSTRAPRRRAPRDADFRHRNLPLLLLQARESAMAGFRPILNAHGITETQWRIVRALLERGPLEQREIGAICRISSPSLAGVLARMDELGLVERERMAHDQRRVAVGLTPKSRTLATRMAPAVEQAYRAIEERIGKALVERLYATLDEAIARLGDASPRIGG